jgi:hypothetical protein
MKRQLTEWRSVLPFIVAGFFLTFAFSCFLSYIFPNDVRLERNLWFGADIDRVIRNMADPLADHWRLKVHPLFSLIILPVARPLVLIAKLIGAENGLAMGLASQFIVSISAGLSWMGIYLLLLSFGIPRFKSFFVSLIFLSSTGFLFWWSTPETFPLGAVTILIPFLLLALNADSQIAWVAALVGAFSMTITNLSAGLVAAYVRFGPRKLFYKLCLISAAVACILIIAQKSYLPTAGLPFQLRQERRYIKTRVAVVDRFYHFFIAPVAPLSPPRMSSSQLEFTPWAVDRLLPLRAAVAIAWTILLFIGIRSALITHANRLSIALTTFLGLQLLLHTFYGDTPFLYSAHYMPVMIVLVGFGIANANKSSYRFLSFLVSVVITVGFPLNILCLLDAFGLGSAYLAR